MEWSYKKMVLAKMQHAPDDMTLRTIEMTDDLIERVRKAHPDMINDFLIRLAGNLNNYHFDECMGWYAVCNMHPAGMSMEEFKAKLPAPAEITGMIHAAQERAKVKAREKETTAPMIPPEYTAWDFFVTYAMYWADYWLMDPDCTKASDFVYCFLSDPDYPGKCKIWNYIYR